MTSKLHLVWLVLLAAIASLAAPSYAGTRVGAFELQEAEFTRAERVLNETCIEAYAVSSDQLAVGYPHPPRGTTLSQSTFDRLVFDPDKGKMTSGSLEELRAGLAAERAGLIDRITDRGTRGVDLVTGQGVPIDVKAPRADFLQSRKQLLKFKGRLGADPNLKILLDSRAVSAAELEVILKRADSVGVDRSRILIPGAEHFDAIHVGGKEF